MLTLTEAQRERKHEQDRRYYAGHRNEKRESSRQYYAGHREERLERNQQYRLTHREQIQKRRRQRYWRRLRPCVDCGKPCRGRRDEPRCQRCAIRHYHYKGGCVRGDGYRVIYSNGRLRPEHDLIYEATYGPLPGGWVVHHKNGDRLDNRLENLQGMTRADHNRVHRKQPHA